MTTIGQVFDVQQGKALSPAARAGRSPRPFLRTANVLWGRLDLSVVDHMDFTDEEVNRLSLRAGDLLVCEGGEVGRTALWDGGLPGCLYQNHIHRLRSKNSNVEPAFVMYWMQAAWLHLQLYGGTANRTTIPNLSGARLTQLPIPLPAPDEQRAIARVLKKVQAALEVQRKVGERLKELKAATTAKLFREGLRGEPLKQTEIGEIPESWEMRRLGDVATIERGKFAHRPRNDPRFYGGSTPFIQTGDVTQSSGRIRTFKQTLNELGLEISRVFPKGTLVLTIAANIGDTGILEFDSAFPDSMVGIKPDRTMDAEFLEYYLRTQKPEMDRLAPKGTQKNINIRFLVPWPVPRPSIDEQRDIAAHLRRVDIRLEAATARRAALQSLFHSMLQLLMTGQVRVPADMVVRFGGGPDVSAAAHTRGAPEGRKGGRPDEAALQEIVRRIVEAVAPEKIILFGSAARGEMGPDSDLDLLVVKACEHRREVARAVRACLRGVAPGRGKDVVVVTPADVERDADTIGYVVRPALREGRVLYAA